MYRPALNGIANLSVTAPVFAMYSCIVMIYSFEADANNL